jgi:hypothetical protein
MVVNCRSAYRSSCATNRTGCTAPGTSVRCRSATRYWHWSATGYPSACPSGSSPPGDVEPRPHPCGTPQGHARPRGRGTRPRLPGSPDRRRTPRPARPSTPPARGPRTREALVRGLPRRCLEPGCGYLVRDGSRCLTHQRQRDQARDAERGTTAQRGARRRLASHRRPSHREEAACRDCGHAGSPGNPLTCDHIVPRVLGGTDDRANLTCRCRRHNSAKGARSWVVR